jgi:3-oxoacyl-(acyl-carrier-protein) synthase
MARGLRDVHPYWMLRHLSNNAHALAAAELGLRGEGATFGGATAGAQAIASACRALEDGAVDAALVIAYDSLLEPETLVELGARRAATRATANPPPAYDDAAAGYVPGEAAAAIFLVRDDAPGAIAITVRDTADGARGEPDPTTLARIVRHLGMASIIDGAAAAWPDADRAERAMLDELASSIDRAADGARAVPLGDARRAMRVSDDTARAMRANDDIAAQRSTRAADDDVATQRVMGPTDDARRAMRARADELDDTRQTLRDGDELDHARRMARDDVDDANRGQSHGIALTTLTAAMGKLGAATAVVQAIALADCLRRGQVYPVAGLERPSAGPLRPVSRTVRSDATTALGISTGAPGLAAAIRLEVLR